jgi:hypothetical protein
MFVPLDNHGPGRCSICGEIVPGWAQNSHAKMHNAAAEAVELEKVREAMEESHAALASEPPQMAAVADKQFAYECLRAAIGMAELKEVPTSFTVERWKHALAAALREGEGRDRNEALRELVDECNRRYDAFSKDSADTGKYFTACAYAWCAQHIEQALAAPASEMPEPKPHCWHKEIDNEGVCKACGAAPVPTPASEPSAWYHPPSVRKAERERILREVGELENRWRLLADRRSGNTDWSDGICRCADELRARLREWVAAPREEKPK